MVRIRLMILWGLIMSIWLCKSLFAGDAVSVAMIKEQTAAETVYEPTTAEQTYTDETTTAGQAYTEEETTAEIARSENTIPRRIEDYVVGVVAAEMPVYFPPEALKAQAVAARTYACREFFNNENTDLYSLGQAYLSDDELKKLWGADYARNHAKIEQAVHDTEGELIMYEDEPILAAFCSASGGRTENSENVWGRPLPYLRSVDSEVDEKAPVYTQSVTIDLDRLSALLGVADASDLRVTKRSEAGYVLSVTAGGRELSGAELRQLLGLRSAALEVKVSGDEAEITSHGYGHGVGMSQYGACYMAEAGCDYTEILEHYYTDIYMERYGVK